MTRERFVLVGLARPRAPWFRAVGQWATSAALPAEFVKCVSAEELRANLASGRTFSAALLDASLPSVDRDLLAAVREAGCSPLLIDDHRRARDWFSLGAAAVLAPDLTREALLDALSASATKVGETRHAGTEAVRTPAAPGGRVVAVCGPGGTGASTTAIALASQLAAEAAGAGGVLLADLALRGEQAMLHDARDIVPGIQELVEAHRGRRPAASEVTAGTYAVAARGYRLLLGLRRPRYWSTVRPQAFDAALASLRAAFATVVCDITADFEGEAEGGSVDLGERNHMARTAALAGDVVVVVGYPGLKGVHALVRLLGEILELGVPGDRLLPVINQAPRAPRARASLSRALSSLTTVPAGAALATPVFLPRRNVEDALRDGTPLPKPLGQLLTRAVEAVAHRASTAAGPQLQPRRIVPGSLGTWTAEGG